MEILAFGFFAALCHRIRQSFLELFEAWQGLAPGSQETGFPNWPNAAAGCDVAKPNHSLVSGSPRAIKPFASMLTTIERRV